MGLIRKKSRAANALLLVWRDHGGPRFRISGEDFPTDLTTRRKLFPLHQEEMGSKWVEF